MTDKEFKRLSRAQLIEVIYQLQLHIDSLTEQNEKLTKALEDKRLRITEAGIIAGAALALNDCFQNAQAAADQYLYEIKELRGEAEKLIADARDEAERIIAEARQSSAHDEGDGK